MEKLVLVNVPDRGDQLRGNLDDLVRLEIDLVFINDFKKIISADIVHRHVGRVVVLEGLMDADDIRMRELGKAAGLVQEALDDLLHVTLGALRPRPDP